MPLLLCMFVFARFLTIVIEHADCFMFSFLTIVTAYAGCFMLSFLITVTAYAGRFMLDFPVLPSDPRHTFYVVLVSQSSRLHFAGSH